MYHLLNAIELEWRYQRWLARVPKYAGMIYGRSNYIIYLAHVGLDTIRRG